MSIWIDASLQIMSSTFVRDMRSKLGDGDWAMFVHPDRDCIYEEALISITMLKYQHVPILPRSKLTGRSFLRTADFTPAPSSSGESRRRNGSRECTCCWWEENTKWTYQDQLSLPFVLRSVGGCDPVLIPECLWQNQWFAFVTHNAEA